MYTHVLFDLDGTLTDSSEGITKCAQLALHHFGIEVENRKDLEVFIGPPLRDTFPSFGVPCDRVEEAVAIFRKRYEVTGKFENAPYPGIRELLSHLKKAGVHLFVATSKPEETAVEILKKFHLDEYFDCIAGASKDASRDSKEQVIHYLLEKTGGYEKVLMVGDTVFDIEGAKKTGLDSAGVTWGFGNVEKMKEAGATCIVDSCEVLEKVILDKYGKLKE